MFIYPSFFPPFLQPIFPSLSIFSFKVTRFEPNWPKKEGGGRRRWKRRERIPSFIWIPKSPFPHFVRERERERRSLQSGCLRQKRGEKLSCVYDQCTYSYYIPRTTVRLLYLQYLKSVKLSFSTYMNTGNVCVLWKTIDMWPQQHIHYRSNNTCTIRPKSFFAHSTNLYFICPPPPPRPPVVPPSSSSRMTGPKRNFLGRAPVLTA